MSASSQRRAKSPGRTNPRPASNANDEKSNDCELVAFLVLMAIAMIVCSISIFNDTFAISSQAKIMNDIPTNLTWPVLENKFGFAQTSEHYLKIQEINKSMSVAMLSLKNMCEESNNNLNSTSGNIAVLAFLQILLCAVTLWAQWHKFCGHSDEVGAHEE